VPTASLPLTRKLLEMPQRRRTLIVPLVALVIGGGALLYALLGPAENTPREKVPANLVVDEPGPAPPGMVWIKGGRFEMGNNSELADETPAHEVVLDGFWMDETEVTNAQFAAFVEATGYQTIAERTPKREDFVGQVENVDDIPAENLVAGSFASTASSTAACSAAMGRSGRIRYGSTSAAPTGGTPMVPIRRLTTV
jgi:formylglycine-generating enzyme required for sulfatase activity